MFATPPKLPAWAVPTMSTTPMSGRTMSQRYAMLPTWSAPISTTRKRVSGSARNTVSGTPTSPLYDPTGATVGPWVASRAASRSFVVVLPAEPVMPMTVVGECSRTRRTTSRASAPIASTASSTMIAGCAAPSGACVARSASTAAAPAPSAASMKSWPSARSPGFAT